MSIIRSQYHSTCRICGAKITPGTLIEWSRGTKPAHEACASGGAQEPAPTAAPALQTEPAVRTLTETVARVTRERDVALAAVRQLAAEVDVLRTSVAFMRDEMRELAAGLRGLYALSATSTEPTPTPPVAPAPAPVDPSTPIELVAPPHTPAEDEEL